MRIGMEVVQRLGPFTPAVRIAKGGRLDAVANLTGPNPMEYANGTPILELPLEKFLVPLTTLVPSQFITASAPAGPNE